eukprot:5773355-Pleurochrysis_carterae.AAC.2
MRPVARAPDNRPRRRRGRGSDGNDHVNVCGRAVPRHDRVEDVPIRQLACERRLRSRDRRNGEPASPRAVGRAKGRRDAKATADRVA